MAQDSFVCLEDQCGGRLKEVAVTESVDGGVCGDSYCYAYLRCAKCESLHYRIDIGSPLAFSYDREQANIQRCDALPSNAVLLD
jgi:hypothetical protein